MIALGAGMEILIVRAVKLIDTLPGVGSSMRMNNIQQHGNSHLMGGIDQRPQLIRCAVLGGSGKEIRHLVAKGSIVRMLHDGHDLNGVVAQRLDPGQCILPELVVRADLSLLLGHADMALVDEEILLGLEAFVSPHKGAAGDVHSGAPGRGLLVLHYKIRIDRDPLQLLSIMNNNCADPLTVLQGIHPRQEDFKYTAVFLFHGTAMAIPAVKIAGKIHRFRTGCPFPIIPAIVCTVEAEEFMGIGKIHQRLTLGQQRVFCLLIVLHSKLQITLERAEVRIDLSNSQFHSNQPSFL